MTITKVLRTGTSHARVEDEQGFQYTIPIQNAVEGHSFDHGEAVCDLAKQLDYQAEYDLILKAVYKFFSGGKHHLPAGYTHEDLAAHCFSSFWERDYWAYYTGKNPGAKLKEKAWTTFVYLGVRNTIITLFRSPYGLQSAQEKTENQLPVSQSGDAMTLDDVGEGFVHFTENFFDSLYLDWAEKHVNRLLSRTVNYARLLRFLRDGWPISSIAVKLKCSTSAIVQQVNSLVAFLKEHYK